MDGALDLDTQTLAQLGPAVAIPAYERGEVTVGIVHLGVGGFHRAHQAMYVDRLLGQGQAQQWGICGVGVLPADRAMAAALGPQDDLYTLVEKAPDGGQDARVIGSLVRYLLAPDDPTAVVEQMADPRTRIVSLTITEGGYNLDPETGDFDADDPAVRADLADGAPPRTAYALVVEGLRRRREQGTPPFTVVSCDNIPGNGEVARRSMGAFARLRDPSLGAWVHDEVAFPSSMVDRITPVTTDHDRAEVARRFGVRDRWPVVCEPFTQWVLEDAFPQGRPPLQDVGVQLVRDVEPYELMKLRLLNASHQALAYFGHLLGHRLVHEAATDPLLVALLRGYMSREAVPTLSPVPGIDLSAYQEELLQRFANPQVRDTVARLAAESSDRIPTWLVPVIQRNLRDGGEVELSAAVVASWARYAEGTDEQGQPIEVVDRLAERVTAAARRQGEDPLAFLRDRRLFGDLVDEPRFTAAYVPVLASLRDRGARATLRSLLPRADGSGAP